MSTTVQDKEAQDLQDLQKRMAGKEKSEQAEILRSYMQESMGVSIEEKPVVNLSDEQVRMIVTGATDAAKHAAQEAAEETERRYPNLSHGEARAAAEQEVSSVYQKHQRKYDDMKQAAKVLRAFSRVAAGRANFGELENAYEEESTYLKSTGRESRAMSIGTDNTGGYLGGEIFETLLYENVSRHSYARKYCTVLNMEREILRIPKLTATVTAEQTSEASTITASQPTFGQFVLNTKKLNVLSKPFSVELFETADPALVPALIEWASREIRKKEDALVFGTSAPGILSHTTNNVDLGGADDSGVVSFDNVTFDDMVRLVYELDPHYIPDEDISGSTLFSSGRSRFWLPQHVVMHLAMATGNDNYHWANVQELKHNKLIHGYEVKRVPSMDAIVDGTNTHFAAFGDLGYMVCGVRPGFRIELQSQGTVDSVNLNETNSYAVRVTEFFDNDCIDDEALSILETASS